VFKLATVALPIDANPYNHNPPMQEYSKCIRDSVASSSIYCKISMEKVLSKTLGEILRVQRLSVSQDKLADEK
jgi:hypothetical protein